MQVFRVKVLWIRKSGEVSRTANVPFLGNDYADARAKAVRQLDGKVIGGVLFKVD